MKHFTLRELIKSDTAIRKGIKNVPNKQEEQNLTALVDKILDPLREAYKKPIIVTSGFRCEELNRFDQLINEYNFDWVHVSFSEKNRKQILKIG